jgi:hypothetical protein
MSRERLNRRGTGPQQRGWAAPNHSQKGPGASLRGAALCEAAIACGGGGVGRESGNGFH